MDGTNSLVIYVYYKNQPFVLTQFSSNQKRLEYHITDVSNNRVFVAVSHGKNFVNLYISEMITNREAKFILSLENIMTFFPNNTWEDSWLK